MAARNSVFLGSRAKGDGFAVAFLDVAPRNNERWCGDCVVVLENIDP